MALRCAHLGRGYFEVGHAVLDATASELVDRQGDPAHSGGRCEKAGHPGHPWKGWSVGERRRCRGLGRLSGMRPLGELGVGAYAATRSGLNALPPQACLGWSEGLRSAVS